MDYINNEDLLRELKIYKEQSIQTEEIGRMLLLLATKYSERGSFAGYTWKEDMISEAVYTCLKYMHNFDINIEDPNPFTYFSVIIQRVFISYITKQKKHSKIKDVCYKNVDFIMEDGYFHDDREFFKITGINYQPIRGPKKKKKKKKKK